MKLAILSSLNLWQGRLDLKATMRKLRRQRRVYVLEHRRDVAYETGSGGPWDTSVFGVFSTRKKAIDYARANLDELVDKISWFVIYDEIVDAAMSHDIVLTSVDRTGATSTEVQPCMFPYLISETPND